MSELADLVRRASTDPSIRVIVITGAGDGYWHFRWEGTGAAVAAEEEKFKVAKKNV